MAGSVSGTASSAITSASNAVNTVETGVSNASAESQMQDIMSGMRQDSIDNMKLQRDMNKVKQFSDTMTQGASAAASQKINFGS
ncbi:hypothetical protein [Acerihabitans arboris]|uniref:Uncharacterized protein n=1 Tax=Acerihabitans arboris TaxID=2691583 RepID=A0A845SHM0_9GAMM|nr:hypothetical protein [Acerihabitans arboris]NDL63369.1 hypothetical protein [Acerihabitans arboris]